MTAVFVAAMLAAIPARAGEGHAAPRLRVVATVSMIGDALEAIGGKRVEVVTLMGEGVDPHLYRQTRSDIAAMVRADAVFWNGLYLEAQLEEFLERLARRKPVHALAEAVPETGLRADAAFADRADPHVWMVPSLWRHAVARARDVLSELDPAGAPHYAANAAAYLGEIDRLAAYARERLATVPEAKRVLVTAHDAFGYFGQAYGFEVIGIQGLSTESEAGLQRIGAIAGLIVERKIEAIFVETSVSDRNIRALIEGAAARGQRTAIGGRLYSDAMGAPGTYAGSYIGMIDSNVTVITRALGGSAPAAGLNGELMSASRS